MELILTRVSKTFGGHTACHDISLAMGGGVYGLLGANGAGKTTLMRMICGVLKPTAGTITYGPFSAGDEGYRGLLGYLPQYFGGYPDFTARDFLLYMASLKGIPKKQAAREAEELLALVYLEEAAGKKIRTFSGGMKRRLGIAQAMLGDPKLLILDEPTAGLDPKERVHFRNLISRLGEVRTVLLSTHIVSDVEYIADTLFVMKEGAIVHSGKPAEIVGAIAGKVWECTVPHPLADALCEKYAVINLRPEAEGVFLRLISAGSPCPGAVQAKATLEDLYLYYFR